VMQYEDGDCLCNVQCAMCNGVVGRTEGKAGIIHTVWSVSAYEGKGKVVPVLN
jgi:hypothetical protein